MRWRPKPEEEWSRDHLEQIVRTTIERIGLDQLCEIIESVVIRMREDEIVAAQNFGGPPAAQHWGAKPTGRGSDL
jgi:hypothetical protein